MKIQKSPILSSERHSSAFFALFFVFSTILFFLPGCVQAAGFTEDVFNGVNSALKWIVYSLVVLFSVLAELAANIFLWVVNSETFSQIMNDPVLYEVWKMVRDTLNLFFIFVLLFSAFSTIFQYSKYRYDKVLLNLILMALLVNFSWPISRFIVDVANSMMYFFVSLFGLKDQDLASAVLASSNLRGIFLPGLGNGAGFSAMEGVDWLNLMVVVICMFLFAISFLVFAVLMLVRMVALPLLVMFSPVGFAGNILPGAKYADEWWKKLFKYAFYGPSAVFCLIVAVKFLNSNSLQQAKAKAGAISVQLTASQPDANFLASLVFFTIPIILFWFVIGQAEKMSSEISGMSVKFGSKMGKWAAGLPKSAWYQTGIPGGVKKAWDDGKVFGKKIPFHPKSAARARDERETAIAGLVAGGAAGRRSAFEKLENKKVSEKMDEYKKLNTSRSQLLQDLGDGSRSDATTKAAALMLAEKEAFANADEFVKALRAMGSDSENAAKLVKKVPSQAMKAAPEQYAAMINSPAFAADPNLRKQLDGRLKKEGYLKTLVDYKLDKTHGEGKAPDRVYEEVFDDIGAEDLAKQDKDLLKEASFVSYLKSQKTSEYRKAAMNEVAKKGNDQVLRAWESAQVAGGGGRRATDGASEGGMRERLREARRESGR
jgi:hypothetical protein